MIRLALALAAACLAALCLGDQRIAPGAILSALVQPGTGGQAEVTLWALRLPRALMALLVGAALGVAGAVCQTVLRNPLAEPGLLGINAGAALAAVLVIVQYQSLPDTLLPWLTFAGACAMSLAIHALAWRGGTTSLRIILIGVGLSALAGAGAGFVSTFGEIASVHRAMIWLAGSLQGSRWVKVTVLALWLIAPLALVWIAARELDLMANGDTVARGLGQRTDAMRALMILATAALSGAAVAASGLIAFVGLAAPHIARRLVGHRHAVLLPASALCGATLVVAADTVARTLIAPAQLPAGLMTGLLGAPFFGWLLWTKRND